MRKERLSNHVAVIGVPSSAGARRRGQEEAPRALRAAGLVTELRRRCIPVIDCGDLSEVPSQPDPAHPRQRNAALVVRVAREVATEVAAAAEDGAFPLVLGGDCSISIGALAGLRAVSGACGVVYFDGDLDLNTPTTTPSGAFDGMVTAHLLGRGHPELARLDPRVPPLPEAHLLYFGDNEAAGGIDPPELAAIAESDSPRFPLAAVRDDPRGTANEALRVLTPRVERFLLHFDVDATDLAAVDVPHTSGLPLAAAAEALKVFLSSPRCAGLVVAELNAHLDADGAHARRLAQVLAEALDTAHEAWRSDGRSSPRRQRVPSARPGPRR